MVSRQRDKNYVPNAQEYEHRWKGYLENTHFKLLNVLLPDLKEEVNWYLRELRYSIRYTEKWRYRYWQLFQGLAVLSLPNKIPSGG